MPKAITQNYFVIIFNVYTRTRIYMHIHTAARKLSKLHKQTKKKVAKLVRDSLLYWWVTMETNSDYLATETKVTFSNVFRYVSH